MGAFATGFLLFGIALVYGASGTFDMAGIAAYVQNAKEIPDFFYIGISTGAFTPAERLHVDGSARIDNALIVNPQTVAAAATITVAARTTAINITATGGTQANAVTYSPTPTSGQVMYIFDGDNDAATFASYTIPAGGFGTFVYLSSAWRVVSIGNNGAPSGAAGGDLTGTYPNPTVATSAINSAKIADGTVTGTDLATNTVANSNLAQMPAYSIKANLTGSTANAADATASADGQVLRRAAGALTFGTIDGSSFGSQAANTVFAAPNGSAGNPTFRALVAADLPTGSTGYIQNNAVGANFATGQAASFDITGNGEINGTLNINGNVGLGLTSTNNKLDIAGATRGGTHATGRPLYVTGTFSAAANGVEFRHDNGTQGVGIGFNTIYATGSNANQDLGLAALGTTGNLTFTTNATNRMTISGTGTVTVPNLGGSGTRLVTADAAGLLATSTTAALTLPTGTGANGQVTYWTGTNTQAGNNNLYWDNTNGRYCNCFGAGAGTWDIGNFDFCAVAQVGFKNNQSNADEDDDIQCAVWPIDATGGAPGEQSNYNTTLYYNYASKPYWRMYAEAYEDSNGVTCGANCINFE
ncbi:unnamed protein product [Rotaria sordida]|uniref:Uncharacterized protein n=1 Tax=Rotaria sordida TaxID=392033 RepID=A0A814FN41_9BILA|nr:unnamed protein product [Rotaria sordida]